MADLAGGDPQDNEEHAKGKEESDQDPDTDLCGEARRRLQQLNAGDEHSRSQGHADQYERRTEDPRDRAATIVAHVWSRRIPKSDVFKRLQILDEPLQTVLSAGSLAL